MSPRRWWTLLVIVPLLGLYGYRAVVGVPAGIAMARGNLEIARGEYRLAITRMPDAAVGFNRFDARWRLADSAIDVWENEAKFGGPAGANPALLTAAARAYLEAGCLAPASRRPWAGLALVYHKLEWMGRLQRTAERYVRTADPWIAVGRPGRVAIGLGRHAVDRAPNWYVHRDFLARAFWTYGLANETRAAVRDAARVLPVWGDHSYLRTFRLEQSILEDFIAASRENLGRVPLVDSGTQLIDLGKLELLVGDAPAAIGDFEAALTRRLDPLRMAEATFQLGLALMEAGRVVEGREHLLRAGEHPVFKEASLLNLTLYAERARDDEQALEHLRELRRVDQENVDYCLHYAVVAQRLTRWDAALEALRWARMLAPHDPRPLVAMVEIHRARDDSSSALTAWRDLHALDPEGADATRLRSLLEF